MAGEALRGPAAVLAGEPVEESDLRRGPALPYQLPGATSDRSVEGGLVAGPSCVAAVGHPFPDQLVWLVGEGGARHQHPELEVLPNLLEAKGAADVPRPSIALNALRHRPGIPATLGDAHVQRGRVLADGEAEKPSVLPEERCGSIPELHSGGGVEKGRAPLG